MKNIKLTIEFDGSRYQGWQRLGKGESSNTISNKITEVLQKMTGENIELQSGARTEVGVHAYGQVVSFKTTSTMELYEIKHYLNRYLPQDIAILDLEEMPERFHASLNAKSKIYLYRVAVGDAPSVFERKYVYHSFKALDVDAMKLAAESLIGTFDFKNFSTAKRSKSTTKEVKNIEIYSDGDELQITLEANDFLHNMPRIIVATLLDVGLGVKKPTDVEKMLSSNNPMEASVPCDPKGLFLQEVLY